jgi:hypothetical protein
MVEWNKMDAGHHRTGNPLTVHSDWNIFTDSMTATNLRIRRGKDKTGLPDRTRGLFNSDNATQAIMVLLQQ